MSTKLPSRIALDTSAYAHLRAGTPSVLEILVACESMLVPATVLGELEAGFRSGSREAENLATLAAFLAEPGTRVLPVTRDVARIYGQVFADLRKAGTPIATNDIWIAATAIDAGAHLLTFDRDFERIRRLDCTILQL